MSGRVVSVAWAAAIVAMVASQGDPEEERREQRRKEIDRLRDIVSHEDGGIFSSVKRTKEQARRVRQMERAKAKRS